MSEAKIPYKIYLSEEEMPRTWYNVRADMKNKPAPLRNPATGEAMKFEDLQPVFCDELIRQELDNDTREIPIPQEIRDFYKMYRPSPRRRTVGHRALHGLRLSGPRLQGLHGQVLL